MDWARKEKIEIENKKILDECSDIINRHLKFRRIALISQYGDSVLQYIESLPRVIQDLNCDQPHSRVQALAALKEHWGMEGIQQVPEVMLNNIVMSSRSAEERCLAIYCLRLLYQCSKDTRILMYLSQIVLNEDAAVSLRAVAYEGLLEVSGVKVHFWPSFRSEEWMFPEFVDWDYVHRCASGGVSPS